MVSGKSEYNIFYLYCTGSPRKWHGKTLPVTGEANQSESQQRLTHHSQALDAGEGNKERVYRNMIVSIINIAGNFATPKILWGFAVADLYIKSTKSCTI